MKVICSTFIGNKVTAEVDQNTTVEELLNIFSRFYDINPAEHSLYLFGEVLNPKDTLQSIGYFQDAVLYIDANSEIIENFTASDNEIIERNQNQFNFIKII